MAIDLERLSCVALLLQKDWTTQASIRAAITESVSPSALLAETEDAHKWLSRAEDMLEAWSREGHQLVTYADEMYPQQFLDVHDFPLVLFYRGKLWEWEHVEPSVAIVGSRDASERARSIASWTAGELSKNGISVVSGLAKGVDTAAHTAALAGGGRPVGVIGTGIDQVYPKENGALQDEVSKRGLLLSQFLPGSAPARYSFPMRNIVMSAFSSVTLIIEAAEKSGTKHQAQAAVRHGRPLVLSSSVAEGTTWGRKLAARSDVSEVAVVSTPKEAFQAVTNYAMRSDDLALSLL